MKLFLLPLILLFSLISSAVIAANMSAGMSMEINVDKDQKIQKVEKKLPLKKTKTQHKSPTFEHCDTHAMPSLTQIPHSSSSQSIPLECDSAVKCCAQSCYSQVQLYLHHFPNSSVIQHSYFPLYHSFSIAEGVNALIKRPPKA